MRADGTTTGCYDKFFWLDTSLGSLSPGCSCDVQGLNKTGNTWIPGAIPRDAKVECHGDQRRVPEATR